MTNEERDLFRQELVAASATDDAEFHRIIQRGFELKLITDKELGRKFGMSKPSVLRWRTGATAPHPAMRPVVFARLIQVLDGVAAGDGPSHPRETGSSS